MSVNVNRSVSDQFYRYKMPRLIAKVHLSSESYALTAEDCFKGGFSWVGSAN